MEMVPNKAEVVVTGWLQNVADFEWGRAVKVAVDVNRKNASGEWEKVDSTLYDCTTDDKTGAFDDVRQVTVVGRITGTNVFQKRDGTTGFSVKVRAESITPAHGGKVQEAAIMEQWPTATIGQATPVDSQAPF